MNRRTILSFAAAFVCAAASLLSGGNTLLAQQQDTTLCEYRITVNGANCSPVQLLVKWAGSSPSMQNLYFTTTYQLQVPNPLSCPPTPAFQWVTLNGGSPAVTLGNPPVQVTDGNGCCVLMRAIIDPDGYVHIYIDPCP